ncbi:ABC transporter substrate-binding protein [Streptomyces sp. NPDC058297]|uniref:ABC transporter substrate-binding protein n=1 Tax=Streptomyces sp. NPDC058297 TaxID=3346433 RepID=UPI0036E99C8A
MRRRTLLAGALAATPLVAACDSGGGASGSTSSGGGGRTTISYGIWDQAQLAGMQQIVKAFEAKNPDISVDIQLTPWSSYWTTLRTSMRGGTAPDVFWMNAVNIQLYAANGVLEPLDRYAARDRTPLGRRQGRRRPPRRLQDLGRRSGLGARADEPADAGVRDRHRDGPAEELLPFLKTERE